MSHIFNFQTRITEELSSDLIAKRTSDVRKSRQWRHEMEKAVKTELEMPPRIDASPEDITRAMLNPDADWHEKDANIDRRYEVRERKMDQYCKDMADYERQNSDE